ncbi:hypothetical protein, partial [Aneurinibacillus migulanus]
MYAVRVILFYPSMDTKDVDCSERKRLPQRDTNKGFCLPLRVCPDVLRSRWRGQKAVLYASVRET